MPRHRLAIPQISALVLVLVSASASAEPPASKPPATTLPSTPAASTPSRSEPPAPDIAKAKRLFSEALVLEDSAAWDAAAEKLRQAIAIKETPGLRYHLAHCQEQAGRLVAASHDYRRAQELIEQGAQAPDVEQLLALARQRMAARVPKLTIVVSPNVPNVAIAVDGRTLEPALIDKAVPIDPGRHRITARASGYRDFSSEVSVTTGQDRSFAVVLEPVPVADRAALPQAIGAETAHGSGASPVMSSSEHETTGLRAKELTLIAEGAFTLVGLGVGIGFALQRASISEEIRSMQAEIDTLSGTGESICRASPPPTVCLELDAAGQEHRTASTWATVGFIGAAAGAASLAVTWLVWPSSAGRAKIGVAPRGDGFDLRVNTVF